MDKSTQNISKYTYTPKQGQYLAFVYYYTKLNGYPSAEADMQKFNTYEDIKVAINYAAKLCEYEAYAL
ncbi:MAG: hypothetical protein HS132_13335 [Planctomycetia bacterium]|nr:hypothetical protein [Planctomycetia bacterium]